jgi:hypothetical protein
MGLDAIRIVTRCTTREQFVALFRRFCSPTSCFVPSTDMRPVGIATAFTIRLADGTLLLRGEGVVLDAWRTEANPFERPGVLLGIHRLAESSTHLYEQLLVPETQAVRPIAQQLRMLHETVPVPVAQLETPTIEMPPLVPPGADVQCSVDDGVPAAVDFDPTERMRDQVATLLGMMPLVPPKVYAAPALVPTEVVTRLPAMRDTEQMKPIPWIARVPRWAMAAAAVAATLTTAVIVAVA